MSKLLLTLLLLPTASFAAQEYRTNAAKVQTTGELCIFQLGVGFVGSVIHCSRDKVPKDAIDSTNAEIDALMKNWPAQVIDGFINSRPGTASGAADFKIDDFRAFMKGLSDNPTCENGRKVYRNQMKKVEADRVRIEEMAKSAEQNLISGCTPNRGIPQKKADPSSGSGSSIR